MNAGAAPARAAGRDIDVAAFRAARRATELRAFEALRPDEAAPGAALKAAEVIVAEGWQSTGVPAFRLEPPLEWDGVNASNRSWSFHLHAWEPLGPVLRAHDSTGEGRWLDCALAVVLDWLAAFPQRGGSSAFAWYDMAVGLRAYKLGYVLDVAARSDDLSDEVVRQVLHGALLHAEALADESEFQAQNNHGLYQAAGQLALATRFPELDGMQAHAQQAAERLRSMVERQFTPEGVHSEHSPAYAVAVIGTLERVQAAGLVTESWLDETLAAARDALAWFVLPDGTLAMLGDTDRERAGADPPSGASLKTFPQSGYAVVRAGDSYLVHACAFHSRIHKHADDLSFVWYDRGAELLVDSGRYGYAGRVDPDSELGELGFWYSDPKRVYVESTRAHNTVEIDHRSYNRRRTRPYGSALTRAGEQEGLYYSEARVRHPRSASHSRFLVLRPGTWLLVLDSLEDAATRAHDFVQRFHFAPELDARAIGDQVSVTLPGEPDPLYVVPLLPCEPVAPVRGRGEPDLLGWVAREPGWLTPVWTCGFAARETPRHVFATLLTFAGAKPIVNDELIRTNATARRARLAWSVGREQHTLDIVRDQDGPPQLAYDVRASASP